jgi:hypothetical protein
MLGLPSGTHSNEVVIARCNSEHTGAEAVLIAIIDR